jgi:hypothetical protein
LESADRIESEFRPMPAIWKRGRQISIVSPGTLLRVQADTPFILNWTDDEWKHVTDTRSTSTALGIDYVDIKVDASAKAPLRFTFFGLKDRRWEHIDYMVAVGRQAWTLFRAGTFDMVDESHSARAANMSADRHWHFVLTGART